MVFTSVYNHTFLPFFCELYLFYLHASCELSGSPLPVSLKQMNLLVYTTDMSLQTASID